MLPNEKPSSFLENVKSETENQEPKMKKKKLGIEQQEIMKSGMTRNEEWPEIRNVLSKCMKPLGN